MCCALVYIPEPGLSIGAQAQPFAAARLFVGASCLSRYVIGIGVLFCPRGYVLLCRVVFRSGVMVYIFVNVVVVACCVWCVMLRCLFSEQVMDGTLCYLMV